jgi:cation diffusion facilitator family transporter
MQRADVAIRRALLLAMIANLGVAAAKVFYGRASGLLAVEAAGYHSLGDALVGLGLARRPPDAEHPYGHRRFELLAGCVLGVVMLMTAFELGRDVLGRLAAGAPASPGALDGRVLAALAATLTVNAAVAAYQARAARRYGSALLLSDAQHTRSDCYVTLGVIASSVLAHLRLPVVDALAAAAVTVMVGKSGAEVLLRNVRYLADTALVDPAAVQRIVAGVPEVAGAYRIRTRGAPDAIFMDLRVKVPPHLSLAETARVARRLEQALAAHFPGLVDVTIHPEPTEGGHHDHDPTCERLQGSRRQPRSRLGLRPPPRQPRRSFRLPRG